MNNSAVVGPRDGPINVLLCLEPRLIRQMTHKALSAVQDIRIVATLHSPDQIERVVEKLDVDWVIVDTVAADNPLLAETFEFLVRNPEVSLLILAADGAQLITRWLSLHEEVIRSPTLTDIVDLLQNGYRDGWREGVAVDESERIGGGYA